MSFYNGNGGSSGDFSRPPNAATPAPPNPMMLMMMNAMKSNPNVDNDWIEYCLPRMMETMRQMSEEFRRKKRGEMISNDEFAKLKQALATIKGPPKDATTNFRQMIGALTMKGGQPTGQTAPPEPQVDPAQQKNRLILQMRSSLRQKYQTLYYLKEARAQLLKLDREIQQLGTEGHFEKSELEELGRLFPSFQGPVDLERDQREFKHTFQRVKEITERANSRARRHMAEKRMPIDQGSRLLADFRAALDAHLQLRRAETVSCLAANAELPCSRLNGLPDTDCVSAWSRLWGQLWKLNVVPNPAQSTFDGPDGDLLRDMFRLFRADYGLLVDRLKPLGLVHPEYGVRVELEHLKADDDLLKRALFPKDPRKAPRVNPEEYALMRRRLDEIEERAEDERDDGDELDMHAKLLKDAKTARDASKRLRTWLGESFNKPLVRESLLERLDRIQTETLSADQCELLRCILSHLEEKRGWLAERFDALDDERLSSCATQLVLVTLTAKSDCIVQLLGGAGSRVAQCLADIKSKKAPVTLNDETVAALMEIFRSEEDVKNEDEIDLDAISDDDEAKPPVDLKSHLKGLLSKVDGLDKSKADKPRFEAISSDEEDEEDDALGALAATFAPPPPPQGIPREEISDSDEEYASGTQHRIPTIDNTSIGDYHYQFEFNPLTSLGFYAGATRDAENFLGNLYEKIATQRRSSKLDRALEAKFAACNTSNLANLTLILTPGDATPTYDEPSSDEGEKDRQRKKPIESAEEGECNDDGVELRPSLRIKNLPSPKRETPKKGRKVMLKVKTPPKVPSPVREAISSDEEDEVEKKEEETKVEEKQTEVKKLEAPETEEQKEKEIEKEPQKEPEELPKKETEKEESREERKRRKSERREAKKAKKEAKKAKKEKKRADKEREEERRKHNSESSEVTNTTATTTPPPPPPTSAPVVTQPRKISTDVDDLTDTEENDYSKNEVTKLHILDGFNPKNPQPQNLNEDPALKKEAEQRRLKQTDVPPPPPPAGKPSKRQVAPPPPPPPPRGRPTPKSRGAPPPPPPPPGKPSTPSGVKVMKGRSLKEALEYIPAQPKKKFATLSSEERVKRLRQELADMEKLMRTGIGPTSSPLASGPTSAPSGAVQSDEYVPAQKKLRKVKKRPPPPPPPPPKPVVLPVVPPAAAAPPAAPTAETSSASAPPPPPPPPKKPDETKSEEKPRKRIDSTSKEGPLKKRILSEQFNAAPVDPFDSFGSAAPPPPPPPAHRPTATEDSMSDSEFGPPLPSNPASESLIDESVEDEWVVKPQNVKRAKTKSKKEKKSKRKSESEK